MGVEVDRRVQTLHEAQGVRFHLSQTVTRVDSRTVTLSGGTALDADFVVMVSGQRDCARRKRASRWTGACRERIPRNERAGIFAAGDVARWPDPHSGERIASSTGSSRSARVRPRATYWAPRTLRRPVFWVNTTTSDQLRGPRRSGTRFRSKDARIDCSVTYKRGDEAGCGDGSRDRKSLRRRTMEMEDSVHEERHLRAERVGERRLARVQQDRRLAIATAAT